MNRIIVAGCAALIASLSSLRGARADDSQRDLASETLAVFSAKCANCHGPNLAKPRGRFGYVLDLARVAANREMIVPSAPEESELWQLVHNNEMPPPDSPTGPLSAHQKDVIRSWIAAGAPTTARTEQKKAAPPETDQQDSFPEPAEPRSAKQALARLGRFHVVVVHFPIALLIAALVAESWAAWHGVPVPTATVRFCIVLGAASAVAAAALGWSLTWDMVGTTVPSTLAWHRWLGTATAAWAGGTALLSEREERRGIRSPWFRVWLVLAAILVAVTGHLGGVLVHGDHFLTG